MKILATHATDKPGPSIFEIIPDGSDRVRISVKVTSPTEITEWEIKYWEGDAKEPKVKKHKLTKRALLCQPAVQNALLLQRLARLRARPMPIRCGPASCS